MINMLHLEILIHMLGAGSDIPKKKRGYRNRYCAEIHSDEYRVLTEMEHLGLVKRGRKINRQEMIFFHATVEGCKAAGLDEKQTRRAMEN